MERHLIDENATIVEALGALNLLSGDTMVLFVISEGRRLTGSLTDGDIRRALLSGKKLTDRVSEICRTDCVRIETPLEAPAILGQAREKGISLLPIVEDGVVTRLIDLGKQRGLLPVEAVLMAGGMGERLRPLTIDTPKPLLQVGGTTVLGRNIALLQSFGINDIYVTVNYLKEKIESYIEESFPEVRCVEEPVKLGTIGSVALIDSFRKPEILVMNADLLTDINLEAMYLRHIETEAWLTMAVVSYPVSVPFAIVDHEGDRVTGLVEKPTINHYANAGIYLLSRRAVDMIPKGRYMDATELVERLISEGRRVTLFPIEGKWLDIGSPDDYRRAVEEIW